MAISFNRYVDITSGVGAGAAVAQRDLILRIFTTNEFIPTGTVMEFTDAADVSSFFGATSQEALRATYYFGFVSRSITRPKRISFARWANIDVGARVFGASPGTLTELQAVTAGGFTINLAGVDAVLTGLDLSGASSFADVATTTQALIRAAGGTFAAVEVAYDAVMGRFTFDSGNTGAESISLTDGAQDPLAVLGWGSQATLSFGVVAETPVESFTDAASLTNNFGSFIFMPTLTIEQYVALGSFNQTQNVMYQFYVPVTAANAPTWGPMLNVYAGLGWSLLSEQANDYIEILPAANLAATNYSARGASRNYMFVQYAGTPVSVTTNADADLYDGLRGNYYGRTQQAGQLIDFYQRGVLGGGATAPVDMNTFANEQWLKDRAGSLIMALQISSGISADSSGRSAVLANLNTLITEALFNGTFAIGKPLTATQRLFITEQSGDPNAFHQVSNAGYWHDAVIDSDVVNGVTEFKIVYQLIYSKDDVVRLVEGTHTLI